MHIIDCVLMHTKKELNERMGWRRGGRGRYPGYGPFRDLPPRQRPGRLYGYRAATGYMGDPSKCARFPWLPRWWWADPEHEGKFPTPNAPTEEQEHELLEAHVQRLEDELASTKKRMEELRSAETEK